MKSFLFVFAALWAALPARACDICAIYDASDAQGQLGHALIGGVAEQYTHFGTLQQDSQHVSSHGEFIDSSVSQVFALYNFNKRFGLQLNLPVIYREWGAMGGSSSNTVKLPMRMRDAGIGDISLVGNYTAYRKFNEKFQFNWSLLGGVKFPTGNSSNLKLSDENLPDGVGGHDLALGSGSYDGIVGSSVFGRWNRWFANASLQYSIRSRGDFGHRYANDLTWSGGPGYYAVLNDNYTLSVQGVVAGETKGKDTFFGVPDEDSAETLVYVGPQVNFTWGNRLNVLLAADLPISRENTGEQVMPDYRIRTAISWKFW